MLAALDFLPAVNALLKSGDEQAIQLYFRALGAERRVVFDPASDGAGDHVADTGAVAAGSGRGQLRPLFGSLVILAGMVLGNGLVYLFAEKLLGQLSLESKISRSLERFHHWLAGKIKSFTVS